MLEGNCGDRMAACGQAVGQFWAPLTTAVQMGHQQTAARSCKRGNWKKGKFCSWGGEGGQLESGTVQLHRGLKIASCNDERRLDEKLNRIAVITNFLSLLHLEPPSHLKHMRVLDLDHCRLFSFVFAFLGSPSRNISFAKLGILSQLSRSWCLFCILGYSRHFI